MSADPSWQLRRAVAEDAAALSLVAGATFLEAFAGRLTGPDIVAHCAANNSPAKFAAWAAADDHRVTLAEHADGAAPLGYTVLCPPDLPMEPQPGDVELKRIYTLTRMHGSGLGRALMERALADARALGGRRLLLGVYHGNAQARRFYEREGFAVAGRRTFRIGASLNDDLIYARNI